MTFTQWLLNGILSGHLKKLIDMAVSQQFDEVETKVKSASLKPVIVKRKRGPNKKSVTRDMLGVPVEKIAAQPAKRRGRKPGSKNRPKSLAVNGAVASA